MAQSGQLPLPEALFGAGAAVEPLIVHDCDLMLGIVTGANGPHVVLTVDETHEGSWIYLVAPLRPGEHADAAADPARLRAILTDPDRELVHMVSTDTMGIRFGPIDRPLPDGWLPEVAS